MIIRSSSDVRPQHLSDTGYSKVASRLLAGTRDGCNKITLRMLTIQPGGHIPREAARGERVIYVLSGGGEYVDADGFAHEMNAGDTAAVPAWEVFHMQNRSGGDLVLLIAAGPNQ
ncbi:MAG TPA: cupin domain-containing protein [Candidatus Fermentibacter sp.]|jgi:quercetin dioxygenase-like cupin family protein|nr:cupin domain-containing protein [Candidatus Fermentibacter sp.]